MASYDETALVAPAFRVLRTMVGTWLRYDKQLCRSSFQGCWNRETWLRYNKIALEASALRVLRTMVGTWLRYDETALVGLGFRVLRNMVGTWLRYDKQLSRSSFQGS